MDKDDTANCDMGSRSDCRNYYGVERRSDLDQGKFVVATVHRWTFYGILIFNVILSASVLNLTFFAKQGARYTATDGAVERAERIQGDQELSTRIDALRCDVLIQE